MMQPILMTPILDSGTFSSKDMCLMFTIVKDFLGPSKKQHTSMTSLIAPGASFDARPSHVTTPVLAPSTISIIEILNDPPMTTSTQSNPLAAIDIPMDPSPSPPPSPKKSIDPNSRSFDISDPPPPSNSSSVVTTSIGGGGDEDPI